MEPNLQTRHLRLPTETLEIPRPAAYYAKSWALVIGINDYGDRHPLLANAQNDALAVAALLQNDYKFDQVFTLYNATATHDAIMEWLQDKLPAQIGPNDRLVFFFAGHGTTRTGVAGQQRGYLIPQDAEWGKYGNYIDMAELCDACGFIQAKHIFIILDCCFSGIAAVTARAVPTVMPQVFTDTYLQRITERRAWQVLTAGAADELVADSGSRPGHSAFTSTLLAGLEGQADQNGDGIITATELANYVKPEVNRETTRRFSAGQTPYFNYLAGSEQGDFVFLRPDQPIRIEVAKPLWPQVGPVHKLPYWLWAVLGIILVVVSLLGWVVWNNQQQAQLVNQQIAALVTRDAVAIAARNTLLTATAVAIAETSSAVTLTPAATLTTTEPPPTLAPLRPSDIPYTGKGVTVAILGTGVDASHPDLRGRIARLEDFTSTNISEDSGHTTAVAGIIAGTGGASQGFYKGLAPEATLYIAKVFVNGTGTAKFVLDGLAWARQQAQVNIILLPLGFQAGHACDQNDELAKLVEQVIQQGKVVIAAAGNSGPASSSITSPGCAENVITVGATDADGTVASFSGRGPTRGGWTKPDLVAPGAGLITLRARDMTIGVPVNKDYTAFLGTSAASAYVTGVVALMLEVHPGLSPAQVKQLLTETAVDLGEESNAQGAGLVDLAAAIQAARGP